MQKLGGGGEVDTVVEKKGKAALVCKGNGWEKGDSNRSHGRLHNSTAMDKGFETL